MNVIEIRFKIARAAEAEVQNFRRHRPGAALPSLQSYLQNENKTWKL